MYLQSPIRCAKKMNKKAIILAVFFFHRMMGIDPLEAAQFDFESEITHLNQLLVPIQEISKRVEQASGRAPAEGTTVLMGVTGSGKTTVFNLLLDIPLCAKNGSTIGNPVVIDVLDPSREPHYKINESPISETSLPVFSISYCDLPGFDDRRVLDGHTRDTASIYIQDIVNAYSINKVLKSIKPVKIMAVVNYDHLRNKMPQFSDLLHHLGTIFSGNSIEFSESLGLVITNFPRRLAKDINKTKGKLKDTFRVYQRPETIVNFGNEQRFALGKLIELSNARITFFYKPECELDEDAILPLDLSSEKSLIETFIGNIRASRDLVSNISLSDMAATRIDRACQAFNNIVSHIVDLMYADMPSSIDKLVIRSQDVVSLRRKLESATGLLGSLSDRKEDYSRNFDNFLSMLRLINADIEGVQRFERIRPFLEFLELTQIPNTIEPTVWRRLPNTFTSLLRAFSSPPIFERGNNILTVKSFLVSASDIRDEVMNNPYSLVNVCSLHSFFFDQNIEKPGLKLSILSPNWIVADRTDKMVNLSGRSGDNHAHSKAQNEHDGLPGRAGQNGGHFYGRLKQLHGEPAILTINVKGGRGGRGQDGGDGSDGADGTPGIRDDVRRRAQSALSRRSEIDRNVFVAAMSFVFTPLNKKFRETYVSGTFGTRGNDGKKGGQGGRGGYSGSVMINDQQPHSFRLIPQTNHNADHSGLPGRGGQGGRGGRHGGNGQVYRGVYIAEYIVPFFRGISRVDQNALGVASHGLPVAIGAVAHSAPAIGRWAATAAGTTAATRTAAVAASRLGVGASIGAVFGYVTGAASLVTTFVSPLVSSHWEEPPAVYNIGAHAAADGATPNDKNEELTEIPDVVGQINFDQNNRLYASYYTQQQTLNPLLPLYVPHL